MVISWPQSHQGHLKSHGCAMSNPWSSLGPNHLMVRVVVLSWSWSSHGHGHSHGHPIAMVISGLCHSWSLSSHGHGHAQGTSLRSQVPILGYSRTVGDNKAWPEPWCPQLPGVPILLWCFQLPGVPSLLLVSPSQSWSPHSSPGVLIPVPSIPIPGSQGETARHWRREPGFIAPSKIYCPKQDDFTPELKHWEYLWFLALKHWKMGN